MYDGGGTLTGNRVADGRHEQQRPIAAAGHRTTSGDPSGPSPAAGVLEALALLAVVLPAALWWRLPSLWFLAPVVVIAVRREPLERFGITLRGLGAPRWHLAVSVIVFGGYAAAHWAYAAWAGGATWHPSVRPDWARFAAEQMLVVGLSEEMFFRGYLQTRFNQRWGRPWRVLGAPCGPGLLLSAVLFGACHVVTGDLTRFRTVVFGLFAGWLRERHASIAVPAAYHGASNVLQDFLSRSLR